MSTQAEIETMSDFSDDKLTEIIKMSLGRVFGMMQRPYRTGDDDEYQRCRRVAFAAKEELDGRTA